MGNVKDIIEWNAFGSAFSLYVKHYFNEEGEKGVKMIFEDETHDKVTEIVIPPNKFPEFLRTINDGTGRYGGLF